MQLILNSILILSSNLRLGLSSGLFPSGFCTETLYALPHTCYVPCPSHSSRLAHLNNTRIWGAARMVNILMTQSLGSRNLYQMTEINTWIQRAWKWWLSFRQIAHSFDAVPPCLVLAKCEQVCHKKPPVSTRVFQFALQCMINAPNKESNCAPTIQPHCGATTRTTYGLTTTVWVKLSVSIDVMTLLTVLKPSTLFRTKYYRLIAL